MTPTSDPGAQHRWRDAAYALRANSRELLVPLERSMRRGGLDFEDEVTGVALAALLEWAAAHPDDAAWWTGQLVEQGRLVAVEAYGLDGDEYDAQHVAGIEWVADRLRIEDEWRTDAPERPLSAR